MVLNTLEVMESKLDDEVIINRTKKIVKNCLISHGLTKVEWRTKVRGGNIEFCLVNDALRRNLYRHEYLFFRQLGIHNQRKHCM